MTVIFGRFRYIKGSRRAHLNFPRCTGRRKMIKCFEHFQCDQRHKAIDLSELFLALIQYLI